MILTIHKLNFDCVALLAACMRKIFYTPLKDIVLVQIQRVTIHRKFSQET